MDADERGTMAIGPAPSGRDGWQVWLGWALVAVGGALLALGWYGVSGQADVVDEVNYLASGSIPGAALVVAGAVLAAAAGVRRDTRDTARAVGDLHRLLTEAAPEPAAPEPAATEPAATEPAATEPDGGPPSVSAGQPVRQPDGDVSTGGWVAVAGGTTYHRPGCRLVAGKAVTAVDHLEVGARSLTACPVCEPGGADSDADPAPARGGATAC